MTYRNVVSRALVLALLAAAPLVAQPAASVPVIPVRNLGAIVAASKDSLGAQIAVRALPNGSVIINDIVRRRVLMFNPTLTRFQSLVDSASTNGSAMATAIPSTQLIRYGADSTLYVDVATQALLVFDQNGKNARIMALPRPQDAMFIAMGAYGSAAMDPKGRLVYRGAYPPKIKPPEPGSRLLFSMPTQPDSGPILRADFDARKVDTITTIKVFQPGATTMEQDGQGNMAVKVVVNPLGAADEWAMLPDGTIAIIRAHDYHIDWVEPNGDKRSTPKMAFDWKRLTDEQKQFKIDSIRPIIQKQIDASPMQSIPTADGPRKLKMQIDFVPIDKVSDYEPPIQPGAVKVDLNGNLWIVPRTSAGAAGGVLYDVVNKTGAVTERVQFPKGYALAGFAPNGDVFVLRVVGATGFLERAKAK